MSEPLDVLLLESHPGVGSHAEEALAAEGHRVHRCFEPGATGFPCVAMGPETPCPVDGRIDVALVVRRGVTPQPTPLEEGVSCAVRSGIPLVEQGTDVLDPFGPWVTARAGDDVVRACREAEAANDLVRAADAGIHQLLVAAGLPEGVVRCRLSRESQRLIVHLVAEQPVDPALAHRLGVRALDAVMGEPRITYREVDVQFHQPVLAG